MLLEHGMFCVLKEDFCTLVVKRSTENPDLPMVDTRACLTCPYYQPYLHKETIKRPDRPIIPTPDDHPDTRPVKPDIKDPFRW